MKTEPHRILIADDNPALHESYRNIFAVETDELAGMTGLAKFAPELVTVANPEGPAYALTHVMQGEAAIAAAAEAQLAGAPFALAILDVRMPPGIDGVQTARRLRVQHPNLQIVLCTAFADYTWSDLLHAFPESDGMLLLKKPFDAIEIHQIAAALCRKAQLATENQELIRNLENRVAARTAQLSQTAAELTIALKAAEVANRAKHDFLRCVSHELNSPLNGIHGAASLLSLHADPTAQNMGQIITHSSTQLQRLFTQIMLYLQLESPPVAANRPQPLQPSGLLSRAMEPHRATAVAKGLTLQASFTTPSLLSLNGRPDLLETALDNLIENALKFTETGSVNVHLRHDHEQKKLHLEVVDTGEGVNPAKRDELASLFSPGDNSLTRKQPGLGIGLALVTRIAQHLGGQISMRPGKLGGSVFTLGVPCTVIE